MNSFIPKIAFFLLPLSSILFNGTYKLYIMILIMITEELFCRVIPFYICEINFTTILISTIATAFFNYMFIRELTVFCIYFSIGFLCAISYCYYSPVEVFFNRMNFNMIMIYSDRI